MKLSALQSCMYISLIATIGSISACKRRKFNPENRSSTTGLATAAELTGNMDQYVSINGNVEKAGDVVFLVTVVDPAGSDNFTNIDVSIDAAVSDYFEKNPLKLDASLSVTRAGGASEDLVPSQSISSGEYNLSFSGNYFFKNGDVFKIVIKNVPAALINSSVYLYANVRKANPEKISDEMATYGSWDYRKTFLADSPSFGSKIDVNIPSAALYNVNTNTSIFTPSIVGGKHFLIEGDRNPKDSDCAPLVLKDTSKIDLTFQGKAQTVDTGDSSLPAGMIRSPCSSFISTSVDADASPFTLTSAFSGVEPGTTFVETNRSVNKTTGRSDALPLGVDVPLTLSEPGGYKYFQFSGRMNKGSQFSFLINGVKKKTGLKISSASMNLYYPSNTNAKLSTFDGKGFELHLINVKTGKIVTDATAKKNVIGKILPTSASKEYVSFDSVGFPDIDDGDYRVTLFTPPSLTEGVYLDVSIAAEKLNAIVDTLNPNVIPDFSKRDTISGSQPVDWSAVNYADPSQDKRKKVAMIETLRHMEEIRDTFHLAVNEINPFTGAAPTKSNLNSVEYGTIEGCLGNEAKHWSDLTEHYYCLYSELRACYTGAIKGTGPQMENIRDEEIAKGLTGETLTTAISCRLPIMPAGWNPSNPAVPLSTTQRAAPVAPMDPSGRFPTLRRYAYFMCSLPKDLALTGTTNPTNLIPGCLARNDIFAYQPSDFDRENFNWISSNESRGKVFRYIMDAPTFAFDDQEQQDIINAFWRVTQPDPAKPNSDCAKRPRRAIDPTDGTHCLPNANVAEAGRKVQDPLQSPANR